MASLGVRQNYHEECEKGVNTQIEFELYAMYRYLAMSSYFCQSGVSLPHFAQYFRKAAHEEMEHAQKLMEFQNMRGGKVDLKDIKKPSKQTWENGLDAMEDALELEKKANKSLLNLHKVADEHGDFQMSDFLENNFLTEQVEAIKELSDHITNLKRVGPGHGEYHFERKLK